MQRLLALALALGGLLVAAPAVLANHSELLGRWHLDSESAGVTPDDSGHGLDGALAGGAALVAGGRFDKALDLGSPGDSQVAVTDNATLEPPKVTVLAWVKLGTAPIGTTYIVAKGSAGCSGASYALTTPAGGLAFHIYNGSGQQVSPNSGSGVWNDQWHAVAGTFDGATVRLYVDGAQVGSGTPAATNISYSLSFDDLRIGNYPGSNLCGPGSLVFPGLIDEVRVYNRALDANEIAFLSASSATQPPNLPPPPTNTAAPSISSQTPDPRPGYDLTAHSGSWTGSPTSYAYQWLRCAAEGGGCGDIAGATGTTYVVTGDDVGKTLRVRVTATNASGTSGPADSTQTKPVQRVPPTARLELTPNPTCTGISTALDARRSTGDIVKYRFTWSEVRAYAPYIFTLNREGTNPLVSEIFTWNRPTYLKIGHIGFPYFDPDEYANWPAKPLFWRDDVQVGLTVTDSHGAQATTSALLVFVQPRSDLSRGSCPPGFVKPTLGIGFLASAVAGIKNTSTSVTTTVPCKGAVGCLGTISVLAARAKVAAAAKSPALYATASFVVSPGTTRKVTAKLTKSARKLLAKRKRLRAKVTIITAAANGHKATRSKTITLRSKKK